VGVAALVLGILGTLLALIPGLFWVAIPLAVISLILGVVGRKSAASNNQPTGMATAGLVLGAIGLVLGVAMWIICGIMISNAKKGFEKALNDPELQKKMNKDFDDAFKKAMEDAKNK
jgi:lysylphosphatidylglycerol synthetase-like protein (DUF2156 family)